MKTVSVIVPVYNAEKFLNITLKSLAEQTFKDIEVILINDGSSDSSEVICKKFVQQDKRFKYFRIDNSGPSNARNVGLSHASGNYIGFCDSDDVISPSMYEEMVCYMKDSGSDIALCDIYSERDKRRFGFPWEDKTVFDKKSIRDSLIASMIGNCSDNDNGVPVWGSVVRCLYKREVISNHLIHFPTDIHFAEDLIFTLQYLIFANRAIICDKALYHYRCNENSIMNSFYAYKPNMFNARKKLVLYLNEIIESLGNQEELNMRLGVTSRCYFRECIGNACRNSVGRTFITKRRELVEIINDKMVISSFSNFDANEMKTRLVYFLIKKRMAMVIQIYYFMRFRGK